MKNGRNKGQSRLSMKDRNRPKFQFESRGDWPGGLTKKEIDTWCERISNIRTALMTGAFKPEVKRWPVST